VLSDHHCDVAGTLLSLHKHGATVVYIAIVAQSKKKAGM
jgi:hypothetical protein